MSMAIKPIPTLLLRSSKITLLCLLISCSNTNKNEERNKNLDFNFGIDPFDLELEYLSTIEEGNNIPDSIDVNFLNGELHGEVKIKKASGEISLKGYFNKGLKEGEFIINLVVKYSCIIM